MSIDIVCDRFAAFASQNLFAHHVVVVKYRAIKWVVSKLDIDSQKIHFNRVKIVLLATQILSVVQSLII